MAMTNIKYASSFLLDISFDLSHQCLLCLYWIGTRGFEFSRQDPITLRTKEPPPFSKNSLNPAKTVWDIMIFWENFSWDLAGCFRGNNTIPLFHLLFPLSENLKIKKELQHCNSQFSISFQIACTAATPTTWCQGPTLEQKNARARTGTRPKLIIQHLHISLPRPWPRSFYQQISCKASHLQHLKRK